MWDAADRSSKECDNFSLKSEKRSPSADRLQETLSPFFHHSEFLEPKYNRASEPPFCNQDHQPRALSSAQRKKTVAARWRLDYLPESFHSVIKDVCFHPKKKQRPTINEKRSQKTITCKTSKPSSSSPSNLWKMSQITLQVKVKVVSIYMFHLQHW